MDAPVLPPRYRIEHRHAGQITVIHAAICMRPNVRTLDPYISRLLLNGMSGAVVVVDEWTGEDTMRRNVKRRPTR